MNEREKAMAGGFLEWSIWFNIKNNVVFKTIYQKLHPITYERRIIIIQTIFYFINIRLSDVLTNGQNN